jgi:tetratricopeptide (TPR) repeat protein
MRARVLACALVLAPARVVAAAPEPEPAPSPAPARSDDEIKQAARTEVAAAAQAFAAGDYQAALDHYAAAMALRPAPKLHYNIGVCHQRLSLATDDPEQRTRERDLAIESYNAYLEQNPQAEDRLAVAQTIRELGGTPVTMPGLKPLFDPTQPPPDPQPEPTADPEPQPQVEPPPQKPPPYPHHGRFGAALLGGVSPMLRAASDVDARSMIAFELHGGGFVGPRRRFALAAYTSLFSGATLRADGLAFYGYAVGLLGQQTWVIGQQPHEALQIGLGAVVALTGQGISERVEVGGPVCSLGDRGSQVAGRIGGQLAPRFDLGILMGPRRRAMIGLIVQPSFALFGDGRVPTACPTGETPWTALGIRRRWDFQFWAGAGFSFRF